MFIKISRKLSKYYFEIGDNPTDVHESYLSSVEDHCLIPYVPKQFDTFVEAHHYASEIVENCPSMVLSKKLFVYNKTMSESGIDDADTPINDKVLECYGNLVTLLEKRFKDFSNGVENGEYELDEKMSILQSLKDEIDKIIAGIEQIIDDINFSKDEIKQIEDIRQDFESLIQKIEDIAPPKTLSDPEVSQTRIVEQPTAIINTSVNFAKNKILKNASQILRAFGEAAIMGINRLHPLSHIKSIHKNEETDDYLITISEGSKDIVGLKFSNNFLLNDIVPLQNNNCKQIYASSFLEKYWVPIVYSVGHFSIGESVVVSNYTLSHKKIYGFNKKGNPMIAAIDIKEEDKGLGIQKSWWLKTSQEDKKRICEFNQEELINAEVLCIDKKLPTYYQHSGKVISVIPRDDYIDLVIDFRRGLDYLVLRDDQVDIINMSS